ncbi:hypothetical protein VTO73DRAFT_12219 [Trametes versicolor]
MPPIRTQQTDSPNGQKGRDLPVEKRKFSGALMEMRGRLRYMMGTDLKRRCGDDTINMKYTGVEYANGVVVRGRHRLVGWPNGDGKDDEGIPFANLSDIPGGKAVMQRLLDLWASGELRFEPVDDEYIDLAKRNPKAVLPGKPLERPAPRCWSRLSRDDIGKARGRAASGINPKTGKPYRRRKDGPKTPKVILDSDIDELDEISSDVDV